MGAGPGQDGFTLVEMLVTMAILARALRASLSDLVQTDAEWVDDFDRRYLTGTSRL